MIYEHVYPMRPTHLDRELEKHDPLAFLVDLLRDFTIESSSQVMVPLLPTSQFADVSSVAARGWADPELRPGYLPNSPTKITSADKIITGWVTSRHRIVYQIASLDFIKHETKMRANQIPTYYGCVLSRYLYGFISVSFSEISIGKLRARISYGLWKSEYQNQGVMTRSLCAITTSLPPMVIGESEERFRLTEFITRVSDKNKASRRVLEKAGFELKPQVEEMPSPVAMGGNSLTFYKEV